MTILHPEIIPLGFNEIIPSLNHSTFTYSQVRDLREESMWRNLDNVVVEQALKSWYKSMSRLTAINYESGMKKLEEFPVFYLLKDLLEATFSAFLLLASYIIYCRTPFSSVCQSSNLV